MSGNDQNALYQELVEMVLRCESSLWLCQTCQEVVFYDRRSQLLSGAHDSHRAVPIPTLYDPDEGCEQGFLRDWIESEDSLSEERRAHLLEVFNQVCLNTEEFLAQELSGDEREVYEQCKVAEAESIVLELF